jgi:hypothetical protein
VEELRAKLKGACQDSLKDKNPDNPVYKVATARVMKEVVAPNNTDAYILDRLDAIESRLGQLHRLQSLQSASPIKSPREADHHEYDYETRLFMPGVDHKMFLDKLRKKLPTSVNSSKWTVNKPDECEFAFDYDKDMSVEQFSQFVTESGGKVIEFIKNGP